MDFDVLNFFLYKRQLSITKIVILHWHILKLSGHKLMPKIISIFTAVVSRELNKKMNLKQKNLKNITS